MRIVPVDSENRSAVDELILRQWYSPFMAVRGELIDMRCQEGFVCMEGTEIVGLLTLRIYNGHCEILSLDSLRENHGVGTALLQAAETWAREKGCPALTLVTTNDNLHAMEFYQKRGFDMVMLYRNAVDKARALKPEIPLVGSNGIPIRHEVEFEKSLFG